MDIVLPGPGSRIPGLDFAANGPKIGSASVLLKSKTGFCPPSRETLDEHVEGSFDCKHAHERLAAISKMLNAGDVALAAIATSQLRLRNMPTSDLEITGLRKAGVDDPRPGWPAGTPGGRGGKFRPKDAAIAFDRLRSGALGPPGAPEGATRHKGRTPSRSHSEKAGSSGSRDRRRGSSRPRSTGHGLPDRGHRRDFSGDGRRKRRRRCCRSLCRAGTANTRRADYEQ